MKKLILSFALIISLVSASFADSGFTHRFFEIKVDVPVSVSNNLMSLSDIFQKVVVVDLPKIADSLPDNGASIKADVAPTISIGVDIPRGLILGINIGAEADVSVGLSKDIFDFIGHGNNGKTELKQNTSNTYADLFAYASLDVGWNTKQTRLKVTGSGFSSLGHFDAGDTYVKVYSNDDKSGFEAKVDAKLYSPIDYSNGFNDTQALLSNLGNNLGFDVGVEYQKDIFKFLTVGGNVRMPLKPSTLSMLSQVSKDMEYSFSFDELLGGSSSSEENNEGGEGENTESTEEAAEENNNSSDFIQKAVVLDTPYKIHRPFKLGVSADFHPFGSLLTTSGYLGIGVRHPFATNKNETQAYIDYSVAGRFSLWNILSFEASHSRMDEIYKNQFALELNIRLVEVDAGVSFQSTSFAKSFEGAGVGAFVTVCVGL